MDLCWACFPRCRTAPEARRAAFLWSVSLPVTALTDVPSPEANTHRGSVLPGRRAVTKPRVSGEGRTVPPTPAPETAAKSGVRTTEAGEPPPSNVPVSRGKHVECLLRTRVSVTGLPAPVSELGRGLRADVVSRCSCFLFYYPSIVEPTDTCVFLEGHGRHVGLLDAGDFSKRQVHCTPRGLHRVDDGHVGKWALSGHCVLWTSLPVVTAVCAEFS